MIFLVTLIALLIERFFDWSHLRRWQWLTNFQRGIIQRMPSASPALILGLTIVPILLATLLIEYALRHVLFGVVEFLFQILLFLYCLGPQNLWADTYACINALLQGDARLAADKLKSTFGIATAESTSTPQSQLLNHVFIAANRRVFAIVFWFLVLGPLGAVLYRTITLAASEFPSQDAAPQLVNSARAVEAVLDWIPIRILTCVFALGGHFVQVFSCWKKKPAMSLEMNETLLTQCGAAALGENKAESHLVDGVALKSAIGLLDRSFIITLVLVAVYVLMS